MQILITERNDITPLLGMDWMKNIKLKIGNILLQDCIQSEKETNSRKSPGFIQKKHHDKRH